jgi:DNA-binding transcriptional MocR family regulator
LTRQRRKALADLALRYNVPIIEDEPYGMLPFNAPATFAELAPEPTYHVTGLSETLGAGLRVGYLKAPTSRQTQRIAGASHATSVMPSPFTVLFATQWINDGTAADVLDSIRDEAAARQAIASAELRGLAFDADPQRFHLWLPVPSMCDWSAPALALQIGNQGIGAVAGAAFSTDGNPRNALRLCLGGLQNREDCCEALKRVADRMADPHHLHLPML